MDKSIVNEVVSALEAVKSYGQRGLWILLSILIVLVLVIAAVVYQRIVIKRFQTASKATQENFETLAADLRKRALEVKRQDEGLRKRDLEDANTELRCESKRLQQQRQVLKESQRAMKGGVSHIITIGLEDIQNRMLQTDFKVMTSVVPVSSKADLQRKPGHPEAPLRMRPA